MVLGDSKKLKTNLTFSISNIEFHSSFDLHARKEHVIVSKCNTCRLEIITVIKMT